MVKTFNQILKNWYIPVYTNKGNKKIIDAVKNRIYIYTSSSSIS